MLKQRVLTALIGLPLLTALMIWGPPWLLFCFFLICVAISVQEVMAMLLPRLEFMLVTKSMDMGRKTAPRWLMGLVIMTGIAILTLSFLGSQVPNPVGAFTALILIPVLAGSFSSPDPSVAFGRSAAMTIAVTYGVFPWIAMYHLALDVRYLFLLLAIVWSGDTGAYFGGRFFGRHKLAPAMSPKKTIEGAVFGLLSSILGGCLLNFYYQGALASWDGVVGVSLLTGILGQLGDLVESALKRFGGIKDSGWILPGHGGILDRVDGLMFGAPLIWLVLVA